MSADDLEVAFELFPPSNSKTGFLGNLWNTMTTCETYKTLRMCSVLNKTHALFEGRQESCRLFANILLMILILGFLAYTILSIYKLYFEERKSLKEIHNQERKLNDDLVTVMMPFRAWKEINRNNIRKEAERKKVNELNISPYMFDSNPFNEFEHKVIVAFADISLRIKIPDVEIFYNYKQEFPLNIELIPKFKSASEITSLIVSEQLPFNNPRKEMSCPMLRLPKITEVSDVIRDKIMKKKLGIACLEPCSKRYFNSTALEAIPEAFSNEILPTFEDDNSNKDKLEEYNLSITDIKPAKKKGIFSERKKLQEKVNVTKSTEQTQNDESGSPTPRSNKTSTNITKTFNETPKKTGIFNKCKSQPRFELLNKHTNI